MDLTIDLTPVRRNDVVGPNHFNDSFIIMITVLVSGSSQLFG